MGIMDRVGRILRGNINAIIDDAEDPKVVLDQAIRDMGEELTKLRQGVAKAIASKKTIERQYDQASSNVKKWQERARLAVAQNREDLAREALMSKKRHEESVTLLQGQLDTQAKQVGLLQGSLIKLESRIAEAKTRRNMLVARAQSAKASKQISETLGKVDTDSAFSAFERMEEKVNALEAESGAVAEVFTDSLEDQFAALESGGGAVDDELAALKAELALESGSGSAPQAALPEASEEPVQWSDDLEAEFAELQKQSEET